MSDIDRTRMIPLHIADQAVAACEAEIQKLRKDYARLKAEVERLTKERDKALTDFWYIHEGYFRLEAEVNRLTASKDGNSMYGVVAPYVVPPCIDKYTAKEGKPHA